MSDELTDDRVGRLLSAAGERWRSTQPGPPEPDRGRWSSPVRPHRRAAWLVAAAVVAVTLGAGAVTLWADNEPSPYLPIRDNVAFVHAAAEAEAGPAIQLVVHDGDPVRGTGLVVARPDGTTRFCALAQSLGFSAPGRDPFPCSYGVPVVGVDLNSLTNPAAEDGFRSGLATLRGTWASGVLTVSEQTPPSTPAPVAPTVPCAPPATGWRTTGYVDSRAIHEYVVDARPEQFRRPWLAYPNGRGTTGASPSPDVVDVLVVEVVNGDAELARQELQRRYAGNLCVVDAPGRASLGDQQRVQRAALPTVGELMRDPANGIYGSGAADDLVSVDLVMLTPPLYGRLATIGLDLLELRPWLRPA